MTGTMDTLQPVEVDLVIAGESVATADRFTVSGIGRELGTDGLLEYVEPHTIIWQG